MSADKKRWYTRIFKKGSRAPQGESVPVLPTSIQTVTQSSIQRDAYSQDLAALLRAYDQGQDVEAVERDIEGKRARRTIARISPDDALDEDPIARLRSAANGNTAFENLIGKFANLDRDSQNSTEE